MGWDLRVGGGIEHLTVRIICFFILFSSQFHAFLLIATSASSLFPSDFKCIDRPLCCPQSISCPAHPIGSCPPTENPTHQNAHLSRCQQTQMPILSLGFLGLPNQMASWIIWATLDMQTLHCRGQVSEIGGTFCKPASRRRGRNGVCSESAR